MRPRYNLEIYDAVNFVPEDIVPRTTNRVPLTDIVLGSIAIAGLISVALIAPNALQLFKYVKFKDRQNRNYIYRIPETVRRLEKQGHIRIQIKNNIAHASLTQKGKEALIKEKIRVGVLSHVKSVWDGKWRVVIFDIQEKKRVRRDTFRQALYRLGFVKVQNSVWAFPYECEEMISLLKMEKEVGRDVLYMVVERIEGDGSLRKRFGLAQEK